MATTCAASACASAASCSKRWWRPAASLRISEAFPGAGEELLEAARENRPGGHGGQARRQRYESRRSREWLKIKIVSEQEFVIGGFTAPQGGREHFGALVLGVYDDGELRWAGNVGTGFDQKLLAALHARLKPLITPTMPVRRAAASPTAASPG